MLIHPVLLPLTHMFAISPPPPTFITYTNNQYPFPWKENRNPSLLTQGTLRNSIFLTTNHIVSTISLKPKTNDATHHARKKFGFGFLMTTKLCSCRPRLYQDWMIHISTLHFRHNLPKLKHEPPLFDLTVYIT